MPEHSVLHVMRLLNAMHQDEFLSAMLPRKGMTSKSQPGQNRLAEIPYEPKVSPQRLPAAVDWRNTGATGPVKDQATCGSCYAFGAVAAMQSALFLSTGKHCQAWQGIHCSASGCRHLGLQRPA